MPKVTEPHSRETGIERSLFPEPRGPGVLSPQSVTDHRRLSTVLTLDSSFVLLWHSSVWPYTRHTHAHTTHMHVLACTHITCHMYSPFTCHTPTCVHTRTQTSYVHTHVTYYMHATCTYAYMRTVAYTYVHADITHALTHHIYCTHATHSPYHTHAHTSPSPAPQVPLRNWQDCNKTMTGWRGPLPAAAGLPGAAPGCAEPPAPGATASHSLHTWPQPLGQAPSLQEVLLGAQSYTPESAH